MAPATPVLARGGADAPRDDEAGEIIVTAQKREEDVQHVPLAVSVIGADRIAALEVATVRDLSGLAPNVTVLPGLAASSAAVIAMRGVSTPANETFGLDTANALYIDGIYIARSAASGLELADVARIEVLRGPQGTLFGRNTTGGALAVVTRLPEEEASVHGEIGAGNLGALAERLRLDTGAIAPGLTASLSYSRRRREGTVDNLLEPRNTRDPGAVDARTIRMALRFAPGGGGGALRYGFEHARVRGVAPAFQLTNLADGTAPPPLSIGGVALAQVRQAPAARYVENASFREAECAALAAPTRTFRRRLCLNAAAPATDRVEAHTLEAKADLGAVRLRLLGGYRRWTSTIRGADLDGMGTLEGPAFTPSTLLAGLPQGLVAAALPPGAQGAAAAIAATPVPRTAADLFSSTNDRRHRQFSTELELSGETQGIDWVAGAFHFSERGSEDNPQTSGFVVDTDRLFLERYAALGPALAAANPSRYRLAVTAARLAYAARAESTALYGQVTAYPAGRDGRVSLTAGARYTWDWKAMTRRQNGAQPLAVPEAGEARFGRLTWTAAARWTFAADASLYARIATGYRSGGFNAADPPLGGTTILAPFREETVTSYELGLKTELLGGRLRLNLAAYRNDYHDLALSVPVFTGSGTFQTRVKNAGRVAYRGIEADFAAILGGGFVVDGAAGYVDVRFREFLAGQPLEPARPVVDIASIARPALAAPFTANLAVNWTRPLGSGGAALKARIGFTHEDGRYSFSSVLASPFNEALRGDASDLVDAQLMLDDIAVGRARLRVMVWVKNLTDDHNLMRGVDFGALGFAGGIYNDPRTWGTTLSIAY